VVETLRSISGPSHGEQRRQRRAKEVPVDDDRPLVVLIVDDDPGDVLIVREALDGTARRRQLQVVDDGEQALDFLRRAGAFGAAPRPDLVLLDLNMPRVDGRQVLAAVKGDPELRAIPVIVLTTSNTPEDVQSAYEHHANAFVTKPLDLDELTDAVQTVVHFFGDLAERPSNKLRGAGAP
jgi:CheY-like chemotaxis protein